MKKFIRRSYLFFQEGRKRIIQEAIHYGILLATAYLIATGFRGNFPAGGKAILFIALVFIISLLFTFILNLIAYILAGFIVERARK